MTLELSRRLVGLSAIELGELDAALLECARTRSSLVAVLKEKRPDLVKTIENELIDANAPSVLHVRVAFDLVHRLPVGICQRLFAVPIRLDSRRGRADIAVVDPADAHVKTEFEYQLGLAVRLVRAPIAELSRAIDSLTDEEAREEEDTVGAESQDVSASSDVTSMSTRQRQTVRPGSTVLSEAPLPLVKRPRLPNEQVSPPEASRLTASIWPEAEPMLASVPESDGPPFRDELSAKARNLEAQLEIICRALERSNEPDTVIEHLLQGLSLLGAALVFSVKGSEYRVHAGARLADELVPGSLRFQEREQSILQLAAQGGYYLGPLPDDALHEGLSKLLPESARRELYVTSVNVAGRSTLMLLVGGYEGAFTATRHADDLARAAEFALDRIVRERKQKHT